MFARILPPPGPARTLALSQLTNAVGDGTFLVCSALYFARIVGLSAAHIGLGLTVGWAVGAVAGVPLGQLADRRGPRGVAVLLAVATGAAVSVFLVVRSFPAFVIAACLYGICQSGLGAAQQALLAGMVEGERRTEIRAYLQSMRNAGLGIGAGIGGLALYADTKEAYMAAFTLDAVGFLISAPMMLRLPPVAASGDAGRGKGLEVLKDRPYALVTLLNTVLLLRMPLISLAIPLWIVQRTAAPGWLVSALFILNTVAVVLFQVRVAQQVLGTRSAMRQLRRSGAVMLAACGVFALSGGGAVVRMAGAGQAAWVAGLLLVAASALLVLGEMMQSSGTWEIGFELAPADRQGQYQGFFGSGVAVARMAGPVVLTTLVIGWGAAGWLLLGGVFVLASYAMGPAVRWAERTRRIAAELPAVAPTAGP